MSVVTPSSAQIEASFDTLVPVRNRFFVVAIAFWHILRRDLTVTARGFIPFLIQVLITPLSLLFVFGKVMPVVGATQQQYPSLFLPGVIAVTIFIASLQGMSISLMLDLDSHHEIEDRLLAPIPVNLVAVEKIVFTSIRSLVATAFTFLEAYLILGSRYQVRTDSFLLIVGILILYTLACAALALLLGSALTSDKIYLLFSLFLSLALYTGCVYYTWSSLSSIRALQIVTLFNPVTYAAEALRFAMVPPAGGVPLATMPLGWSLLGMSVSFLLFLWLGVRVFRKKVIS